MTPDELTDRLYAFLQAQYPGIEIRIGALLEDLLRLAIYFTHEQFSTLYPAQRYHFLRQLIPDDFYTTHLADTIWFELAPGEDPAALVYPDEDIINAITPDVLQCLHSSGFFTRLDAVMCPAVPEQHPQECRGDFRLAKEALAGCGFAPNEFFDVLHVLMQQGAYCDCEILYNVADDSRLKARYWTVNAAQ